MPSIDLLPDGLEMKPFMTPEEHREFSEETSRELKPELDRLAKVRRESEAAAREHFIPARPPTTPTP